MIARITVRYQYSRVGMAKIKKTDNTKCWEGYEMAGTLIHYWWEYKMETVCQLFVKYASVL